MTGRAEDPAGLPLRPLPQAGPRAPPDPRVLEVPDLQGTPAAARLRPLPGSGHGAWVSGGCKRRRLTPG